MSSRPYSCLDCGTTFTLYIVLNKMLRWLTVNVYHTFYSFSSCTNVWRYKLRSVLLWIHMRLFNIVHYLVAKAWTCPHVTWDLLVHGIKFGWRQQSVIRVWDNATQVQVCWVMHIDHSATPDACYCQCVMVTKVKKLFMWVKIFNCHIWYCILCAFA